MSLRLVDAQSLHRSRHRTFDIPSDDELSRLAVGHKAKIAVNGELFWVTVTGVAGDDFDGQIIADLILKNEHGLSSGDIIRFKRCHIFDVCLG